MVSETVGKSGAACERAVAVVASAFTLPDFASGNENDID
jgi:hypothetical protein